ncbi:ATP-grasp domain-containing protein [Desulfovibrio inopinatus]|uniref:ATP-grasp domain-containing protein n=1 Tax=Desulfovibrio inopinatus TaxID=102109 RepID=UPI000421B5E5|nr:ATP-grasp domain-containing protein [Desulfovibrio inopinatus]
MKRITVGVTGINATDNPGSGIGVARSLLETSELDIQLVGLCYDAMETGAYMDWIIPRSYLLPYPGTNGREYVNRLLSICTSAGIDILIPNLDAELPVIIRYRDEIERAGVRLLLPDMTRFQLRGKDRLTEIATSIGLDLPTTRLVSSRQELVQAVEDIDSPVMVKGIFHKALRATSTEEALSAFDDIASTWGFPVIVQKLVPGQELNVIGLGDGKGSHLGLLAVKKINTTSLGKIWTGVTVRHDAMLKAAAEFVARYRWPGPFELECLVNGDNVSLIEINPRFPAWVYFATGSGVNLPARLVRLLMNMEQTEHEDYQAGKMLIRYTTDLVTDMTPWQNFLMSGELS